MSRIPTYSCYIDWFGHGGLNSGLSNWHYRAAGPPVLTLTDEQTFQGDHSIKVDANGGTTADFSRLDKAFNGLKDVELTVKVWVYLPSGSFSSGIRIDVYASTLALAGSSGTVTTHDAWVELSVTFTPSITTQYFIDLIPIGSGAGVYGDGIYYLGWSEIRSEFDDVSCDFLATRAVPTIRYGRDKAQELAGIRPGEMTAILKNVDGKYAPGNPLSPVVEGLRPNRQIVITATHDNSTYILFSGYVQDYVLSASVNDQSVSLPCVDILTRLNDVQVSTDLYESARTGEAIAAILEASGTYQLIKPTVPLSPSIVLVPFRPYIDVGMTTLQWWSFKGSALEGLQQVLQAEGPPALYTIGKSNQLIFKDRAHRKRADYIVAPAYTVVACEDDVVDPATEFPVDGDSTIDASGWETFANRVQAKGTLTAPAAEISTVWQDPEQLRTFSYQLTVTADLDQGFIEGVQPVGAHRVYDVTAGSEDETNISTGFDVEEYDFVIENGEVRVDSYAASGTKVVITMTAYGTATISGLQFRARTITQDEVSEDYDNVGSQTAFGTIKSYDLDAGDAGINDARDIALWVLRQNSSPRPRAEIILRNISEEAMTEILATNLSQALGVRVHPWYLDTTFTVEALEHRLGALGRDHTLTITAEANDPQGFQNVLFTFDEADNGFDVGVFAQFPGESFTFGDADQGFDDGVFGIYGITDVPIILGSSQLDSTDEIWY